MIVGRATDVARLIIYIYLCSRYCAYCAGSNAINTLTKSDLTFSLEEVSVSFLSVFVARKSEWHLKKETENIQSLLNFKLKCQD